MTAGIELEREWLQRGVQAVGLDEAGRGCWAGPVTAAAVRLGRRVLARPELLDGVDDSKQLTAVQRAAAAQRIRLNVDDLGIGIVPAFVIDAYGIVPATRLAMTLALLSLRQPAEHLLIDALPLPELPIAQTVLIRGDAQVLSIAAASILAKTVRDGLMTTADAAYPGYAFGLHKGYGTAAHQAALQRFGPCRLHRLTFRPLLDLQL
jgi:ribonuclease HII